MFFLFNPCIDISLAIKYAFENSQQSKLQLSPTNKGSSRSVSPSITTYKKQLLIEEGAKALPSALYLHLFPNYQSHVKSISKLAVGTILSLIPQGKVNVSVLPGLRA